jgi:hypothetical protein
MFGVVKWAVAGAVLSCGAVAAYELPTRKIEAEVQVSGGTGARPAAPRRPVRASPSFAGEGLDRSSCKLVRRKLWVEGEGWIVKSVVRC